MVDAPRSVPEHSGFREWVRPGIGALVLAGIAGLAVVVWVIRWRIASGSSLQDLRHQPAAASSESVTKAIEPPPGMVRIPGGTFWMGIDAEDAWPDERPAHRVTVDPFWIDAYEVTNAQFRRFVEATGYRTTAERAPSVEEILAQSPPGTSPPPAELLVPGALVFTPPEHPVRLDDVGQWWRWTPGANWRHPTGPGSSIEGMDDHPVVLVSWEDAAAYAQWAGKRLPTEAEWECAARGGLEAQPYVWGSDPPGDNRIYANLWQGRFPDQNTLRDGYERTAPVGSFPPNGYGLFDMAGNVWEWCSDWYDRDLYRRRAGRPVVNPQGPSRTYDPTQPYTPLKVQRGGSFLCHDSYCSRYRPSARHGCAPDTGLSHVGFRCAWSPGLAAGSD
ncbi:MAG: hypothetical protein KatS3mg108_3458 [Isosphaeraceae bacterium]|jgi:formylglycine-generating enzyme required for sulfatase activity|nr:MAG: hypothetical protein KatS3mg108_3458 [Isosphaeraceae bacterium]